MAIKIDIDNSSLVELNKTLKALREQQSALTTEGTAGYAAFQAEIDNVNGALQQQIQEYDSAGKSVSELKQEYKVLKDLQAEATDPAEVLKLAQATGKAKDQMADLNEQVKVFASGSQFEQAGNALGQVKDALLNLDFSKASDRATSLASVVQGISFKSAIGGLKDLGTTFIQLGKALLTNPIFLLAAAITLIVIGIGKLLDSLGLLKPILDIIKAVIGAVIDAFKALTDWLGLTSYAAEENAERVKKAQEENREQINETAKQQEEIFNLTQDLTEEEIKNLEKRLGKEIQVAGSIYDIKIKQAQDTIASIDEELAAAEIAREAQGEFTEEQQKNYDELQKKHKEASNTIVAQERGKAKAIEDINRKSQDILKSWQLKNIADANERAKAEFKIQEEKALREIDLEIKKAKGLGQSTKDLEAAKLEVTKFFGNEALKIDKDVADQRAKAATDAAEKRKNALQKKLEEELKALVFNEQEKIRVTTQGTKERLDAENDLLDKQIKFYEDNFKSLNLSELEKNIIIAKYNEEKLKINKTYNDRLLAQEAANNAERLALERKLFDNGIRLQSLQAKELEDNEDISFEDRLKNANNREAKLIKIENENALKRLQILDLERIEEEAALKKKYDQGLISKEDYEKRLIDLDKNFRLEEKIINEEAEQNITRIMKEAAETREKISEDEKAKRKKDLQETLDGYQQIIDAMQSIRGIGNQLGVDLISTGLTGIKTFTELASQEFDTVTEKVAAYASAIGGVMSGIVSAFSEASKQRSEENLAIVEENLSTEQAALDERYANGLISQEEYEGASENLAKASWKEMEAVKEKAFEDDKKAKIAQATIAGIMGAVQAFTGAMQLGPVAGPIVGALLAAAVGALTVANIAKIKSTKYKSSGGGGGSAAVSTPNTNAAVPSFNLFGQGNNANTTNASPQVTENNQQQQTMMVKAVVVESDITNAQTNVARYNESATL
jgi:uncharacterized membrane protein